MEYLDSDIVQQGRGWRLTRLEIRRAPMLGAIIEVGPWHQQRYLESGGLIVATTDRATVYGPGHRIELQPGQAVLYLPVGVEVPLVEWVLAVADRETPGDAPGVDHSPPTHTTVDLPLAECPPNGDLYPDWATPWLTIPRDVGTWASCLDVRATSLTQRTNRLVGVSAKKLLSALRATVAFELAEFYRGRGADLAQDVGYSSQSHLSQDISRCFGVSLRDLLRDEVSRELDWLRLLKSTVR